MPWRFFSNELMIWISWRQLNNGQDWKQPPNIELFVLYIFFMTESSSDMYVCLSLYFGELFVCNILSDQINYLLSAIYYINDLIFDVQAFLSYCVKLT